MHLTGRYQKYGLVDNACSFYLKQQAGCACGFFCVWCAAFFFSFFFIQREQPGSTTSYRQQHCSTTNRVRLCPLNKLDFGMEKKKMCLYKRSTFGCAHCLGEGVCASHYLYLTVCVPYTVPPLALDLTELATMGICSALVQSHGNAFSLSAGQATRASLYFLQKREMLPARWHNAKATPVEWNKSAALK